MLLVILSETSATSTLKMFGSSEGTTKCCCSGCWCCCTAPATTRFRAVKDIPVGPAYATWSGTGIRGIFDAGDGVLRSASGYRRDYRHGVIASGIVIMNLFSKMGSEESEDTPVKPVASSSGQKSPTNEKGIAYV